MNEANDEYWSDFSDDNYEVEKREEREILNLLYHFQNWIQNTSKSNPNFYSLLQ
jgi:hypothetical protein